MIGRILSNRYKLIAELGSGGMAWVYLAEDLVQGEKVAVKVLYPQYSQDVGFLQRFAREARLSMALYQPGPQPHIVHVLDYGADQDTHYLVMEFVPGQDLGRLLEEQGALPWRLALGLARQVALALEQAHRQNIVHRDVKPSNIMVQPDGTVRVLDFGIARAQASPSLTLSGFVGSPNYAAPEQVMGRPVDTRADIYSLGVMLYRMLGGELPFQGDTPWAVVSQHLAATPPALEELQPGLPRAVVRLVNRAMAKRPEDRFQTPAELIEALDALLAQEGLDVGSAGPVLRQAEPDMGALYTAAQQAMHGQQWHEAVDLLSRILRSSPDYRDASHLLGEAGRQIRLAGLYRAALRAIESGEWELAEKQLAQIVATDAAYRDVQDLRERVRRKRQRLLGRPAAREEAPTLAPRGDGRQPAPAGATALPRRRILWAAAAAVLLLAAAGLFWAIAMRQSTSPPPSPTTTALAAVTSRTEPLPSQTGVPALGPTATQAAPGITLTAAIATALTPAAGTALSATPTGAVAEPPQSTARPVRTAWPEPSGQIAFPRFDRSRGTYDIFTCQVDGSGCQRLVTEASQPDFAPGGQHLVYHSWKPEDKGIFVLFLDDQRLWRISGQIEAARPSVDARGEGYVFHSRQEPDRQPRLYRTYGLEVRPLAREGSTVLGLAPSWTPGGRILYTGCLGNACGILLMQADGSRPRQIIAGGSQTDAEASPGGERLTFMSWEGDNWEVYIANLDGSGLRPLARSPANDGLPTWSPDGSYVAFVSNRDGAWAVWIIRQDGTGLRRLFPIGGPLDGEVRGAAQHEIQGWVEERISWAPNP